MFVKYLLRGIKHLYSKAPFTSQKHRDLNIEIEQLKEESFYLLGRGWSGWRAQGGRGELCSVGREVWNSMNQAKMLPESFREPGLKRKN